MTGAGSALFTIQGNIGRTPKQHISMSARTPTRSVP